MAKTRRQHIEATARDLMSAFLYYDRKEDPDLPRGSIESALLEGEITVDDLLAIFEEEIRGACPC